jgi:hypothetical protein
MVFQIFQFRVIKLIRGQKLVEGRSREGRLVKAFQEGQGPPRAVEPMMMMMIKN